MNKSKKLLISLLLLSFFCLCAYLLFVNLVGAQNGSDLKVYLKDGRFLNVVHAENYDSETIMVRFSNGVTSKVPKKIVDETKSPEIFRYSVNERFIDQEREMSKVLYEKADWLTLQPYETVSYSKSNNFALYKSDLNERSTKLPEGNVKPDENITFHDLRYYPEKRSYENFKLAFQKEIPNLLSKPRENPRLETFLRMVLEIDDEYSKSLAEASLRFSDKKTYVDSFEVLCEVYYKTGDFKELERIVSRYSKWRVSKGNTKLFKNLYYETSDPITQVWLDVQYAVLTGANVEKPIERAGLLVNNDDSKKNQKYQKLIVKAVDRNIFHKNPFENLSEVDKIKIEEVSHKYKNLLDQQDVPLLERYAYLSEEELLSKINLYSKVYGNMSNETADVILYLLEQRNYDGVKIPVNDLLWSAIHTMGDYDKYRAMPIFSLTQKTAVLNPGDSHSKKVLSEQFGVEAGLYYARTFHGKNSQKKLSGLLTHMEELTRKSVELSKNAAKQSKAYSYRSIVTTERWDRLAQVSEYRNTLSDELKSSIDDENPNIRRYSLDGYLRDCESRYSFEEMKALYKELLGSDEKIYVKYIALRRAVFMGGEKKDLDFLLWCQQINKDLLKIEPAKTSTSRSLAINLKRIENFIEGI